LNPAHYFGLDISPAMLRLGYELEILNSKRQQPEHQHLHAHAAEMVQGKEDNDDLSEMLPRQNLLAHRQR